MKHRLLSLLICLSSFSLCAQTQGHNPDTVKVGIYVTSIHDIDFKQKEYAITLWLWMKYKNRQLNFQQNLEVPMAKTFEKSFSTIDSSGEDVTLLMKLQCVMKDSWRIGNFPFDRQALRFSIENSQFDSRSMVFVADTLGKHFDPRFTLRGWRIDSCILSTGKHAYETGFGDETLAKPHTEYSAFRLRFSITRDAGGLFWKMFIGMYVAFLIAFACFFIHSDSVDSRFGLSVGSLFAVIGNKYIIDSSLPESTSFTLVDTLHGLTLLAILVVVAATCYSLILVKNNKVAKANRFDMVTSQILLIFYVVANIYFIMQARSS